jgi:hypothetical protein
MSTIKISDLATSNVSLTDFIVKAGATGIATKNTVQGISDVINANNTLFKETIAIADVPSENGWYFASESGTYTNCDGLVIDTSDNIAIIVISGTFDVFNKIDIPVTITADSTATDGSTNAIQSNAVFDIKTALDTAISLKQDALTFDTTPTEDSTNVVQSGGVFSHQKNEIFKNTSELSKNLSFLLKDVAIRNRFNQDDLVNASRIKTDGTRVPATSVSSTDFTELNGATSILLSMIVSNVDAGLAFYSSADEADFISFEQENGSTDFLIKKYDIPATATHFRTCFWNTPLNDVSFYAVLLGVNSSNPISENIISITDLNNKLPSTLTSYNSDELGSFGRVKSTGSVVVASSVKYTDFIDITGSTSIELTLIQSNSDAGLAFYSSANEADFISFIGRSGLNATLTEYISPPTNGNFIRTTFWNDANRPDATVFSLKVSDTQISKNKINIEALESKTQYQQNIDKFSNFKYKAASITNGTDNSLVLGLHGDSWTHLTTTFCMYPTFVARQLRLKYGNGGGGFYDFGSSTSSQFFRSIDPLDASDSRSGTITYIDEGANALGINCGHAEMTAGATITLDVLTAVEKLVIHYIGDSTYGTFRYRIDSGTWVTIDASTSDGYFTIDKIVTDATHNIEFECLTGIVVVLGVDMQRTYGARVHKFGNRGLKASDVLAVDTALWKSAVTAFGLDSFTTLLGVNDGNASVTPTVFSSEMKQIHDLVKEANEFVDYLIINPSFTERSFDMATYNKVLLSLAAALDVSFLSLIPIFGSTAKIIDKGTFFDQDHPTIDGGKMIQEHLCNKILI